MTKRLKLAVRGTVGLALCYFFAHCDSRRLSEELRDCPSLARDHFSRPDSEIVKEFTSHNLDTQFAIYICGNQYMHPPYEQLSVQFASQGDTVAMYLRRKLEAPEIDDLTVRDILLVFEEMQYQSTYDIRNDTALMELLRLRVRGIRDPFWRAYADTILKEIRASRS